MQISEPIKVSSDMLIHTQDGDLKTRYVYQQQVVIPDGVLQRVITLRAQTTRELGLQREKILEQC